MVPNAVGAAEVDPKGPRGASVASVLAGGRVSPKDAMDRAELPSAGAEVATGAPKRPRCAASS